MASSWRHRLSRARSTLCRPSFCASSLIFYCHMLPVWSMHHSHKSVLQKHAVVTPLLKKPGLDAADMSNYRPVSNLRFMSKVVERAVAKRSRTTCCRSINPPTGGSILRRQLYASGRICCPQQTLEKSHCSAYWISRRRSTASITFCCRNAWSSAAWPDWRCSAVAAVLSHGQNTASGV